MHILIQCTSICIDISRFVYVQGISSYIPWYGTSCDTCTKHSIFEVSAPIYLGMFDPHQYR